MSRIVRRPGSASMTFGMELTTIDAVATRMRIEEHFMALGWVGHQ